MSLLNTISPDQAQGKIKKIYDEITALWGGVPGPLQLMSLNADALENLWHKLKYQTELKAPSQKLLTMIRLLVSKESECEYCIGYSSAALINDFGLSVDEVVSLKKDPSTAPLDEKEKALLLFVLKSVYSSTDIKEADIQELRNLGVSDKEMVDAVNAGVANLSIDILINTFKVEVDY